MQAVGWFVPGLAGELIERIVLLVRDIGFVLQPQRLDFIHTRPVEEDRESNEVAISFDQVLHALRDFHQNPEWRYVQEGPIWRGKRVLRW